MTIVRLQIVLEGVTPPISRILDVPATLRLDRLHQTLQAAMGWEDCHLYEFTAGEQRWSDDAKYGLLARKATVADALDAGELHYVYDFGDGWRHRVEAQFTGGAIAGHLYPRLVAATGTCPPEDVGGPPGYEHFLSAISDPNHPEHENLLDWVGGAFDSAAPEMDALAHAVTTLAKRWRPRSARS